MEQDLDNHFVGMLTNKYLRVYYFYVKDSLNLINRINCLLLKYKKLQFQIEEEDANWDFYKQKIYPDEYGWRTIWDSRVIEKLKEQEDTLTESREISHWVYFKDSNNRKAFLDKIEFQNFKLVNTNELDNETEYPYCLVINRIDNVDWSWICSITRYLMSVAKEFNGKYDGWETHIICSCNIPENKH